VSGLVYAGIVILRALRQKEYKPVGEDWLFHVLLPGTAYFVLLLSGLAVRKLAVTALFGVAAVALGLLFIGIHNAWDTVTYVVTEAGRRSGRKKR
jgi:hypothetical protein